MGVERLYNWVEFDEQVELSSGSSWVRRPGRQLGPDEWALGLRLSSPREQERHNVTVITVGSRYHSLCSISSSLSHATLEQPFRTLAIKWEVKYFYKEVFLRLYHYDACVICSCVCLIIVSLWYGTWQYNIRNSWQVAGLTWRKYLHRIVYIEMFIELFIELSHSWMLFWYYIAYIFFDFFLPRLWHRIDRL